MSKYAESWLEKALGGPTIPDPRREGENTSIQAVVAAFIRNDAGYSRGDVSRYVNQALQNEAGDVRSHYREARELQDYWETVAEDETPPPMARKWAASARRAATDEYASMRDDLGEAVRLAQRSGRVLLDPSTCRWVVELDHDGYMSETMDVDVPEMFGPNPHHATGLPQVTAQTRAHVDLSREADVTPRPERQRGSEPTPIRKALEEIVAEMEAEAVAQGRPRPRKTPSEPQADNEGITFD